MPSDELCFRPARELAALVAARQLSACELMTAYLARIEAINPEINALVALLDPERCRTLADEADRQLARGVAIGPLHGLPIAFKDLEAAVGFPFTRGSPIFRDDLPNEDTLVVERLRQAGALPIGKTNVPEFGMGSQTYNRVYGSTRNPYDPRKTAGGSSGGAGAALAAGLIPIADGSDLGGSLRNPASFNNVVGFRPSAGLVPTAPNPLPWLGLLTKGPMARSVTDVAFLMSVLAGPDPRDPATVPSEPSRFLEPLERDLTGARVAWSLDLGGLPVEPDVRSVLERHRATLESIGCIVEDATPQWGPIDATFLTLRRWRSTVMLGPLLDRHRDALKPEAVEEIEAGLRLTGAEVARAFVRQGELMDRLRRFHRDYDYLVSTVSQVAPFDVETPWPRQVAGIEMASYTEWMKSAYWISCTLAPAISVPAGFTERGLPVGIQIVGRYRDDVGLLALAYAFEQATGFGTRRPNR